jgi:hypothetical protein
MPIYLQAPATDHRGVDGKGWNRLSLSAHIGQGSARCALRPTSYESLVESQDTRRARWGGSYAPCVSGGDCGSCPIASAAPTTLQAFDDRVLVRVDHMNRPHLMNQLEKGWDSSSMAWTWDELSRLEGWTVGRRHRDEHGEGFWLDRA